MSFLYFLNVLPPNVFLKFDILSSLKLDSLFTFKINLIKGRIASVGCNIVRVVDDGWSCCKYTVLQVK